MSILIFVSYCHKDGVHQEQIDKHLAPLKLKRDVEVFVDSDIHPGEELDPAIRRKLRSADILLALASHNYLASPYCYKKEYRLALRRMKQGTMHVVVAMVGTCDWLHTEMARYKALPKDAKPVDQYGNRNVAYLEIVAGVRRVVEAVRREQKKAAKAKADDAKAATESKVRKAPVKRAMRVAKVAEMADPTKQRAKPAGSTTQMKPKPRSSVAKPSSAPSPKPNGKAAVATRRRKRTVQSSRQT